MVLPIQFGKEPKLLKNIVYDVLALKGVHDVLALTN